MARQLRLEYPGAIHHITAQGNARQDIVSDDADRQRFLTILASTVARYKWICHAYCLMDNHYHLLIETPDPNLSLGMRQLNGIYTQAFNRSHKRIGHVFQGRFKSILVEKGAHLLELCRYIVLNPVKAGAVERPEDWPWSSYSATAGLKQADDFLSTDWILAQFSRKKREARTRYVTFVHDGLNQEASPPWDQLHGQIFFGGSQFILKMRELLNQRKDFGEIPRKQRYAGRPELKRLFAKITDKNNRNKRIAQAHLEHGYTLKEIADALEIHYTTVSRVVKLAL